LVNYIYDKHVAVYVMFDEIIFYISLYLNFSIYLTSHCH